MPDTMNGLEISIRLALCVMLAAAIVALAFYTSASWVARRVR